MGEGRGLRSLFLTSIRHICHVWHHSSPDLQVAMIDAEGVDPSKWMVANVGTETLAETSIGTNRYATVDARDMAVNEAQVIRFSNSAHNKYATWKLHEQRDVNTLWNHAAGPSAVNGVSSEQMTVYAHTGSSSKCYQNKYGIMKYSGHGGAYPSTTFNDVRTPPLLRHPPVSSPRSDPPPRLAPFQPPNLSALFCHTPYRLATLKMAIGACLLVSAALRMDGRTMATAEMLPTPSRARGRIIMAARVGNHTSKSGLAKWSIESHLVWSYGVFLWSGGALS